MTLLIYLISFLEWFTTLSIEIIAIRRFTPIIWTNSISTSIILWVILLALSYWYYIWGKNTQKMEEKALMKKLIFNVVLASIFYLCITFIFDKYILEFLINNINSYFWAILLSSFILFFVPVFFASQTIPLLSEILKWKNTWEKIWKLLFFSTIGSFLGSVLTSSVLFPILGVYKSAVLDSLILALIWVILAFYSFKKFKEIYFTGYLSCIMLILSISIILTKDFTEKYTIYKTANSYHDIEIFESNWKRIFSLNWWLSSWIDINTKDSFFFYIEEIKKNILQNKSENKKILVIWAAGFTLPAELSKEENISSIDVVDVDSSLKDLSEKYFLKEKLSNKINFIVEPSRYFLNQAIKNNKFYDDIVIDIYIWKSLPPQTLTEEFFKNIKKIWKNIYINIISDRKLETDFSKNLFNTIQKSFWQLYYKVEEYDDSDKNYITNFIVTNNSLPNYKKYEFDNNFWVYKDDKNSIELDIFKRGL